MAGEKHLKLAISGSYTVGSDIAGEIWQCNIREALVFGTVDDIGVFPSTWDVAPEYAVVTASGNTIETSWKATSGGGAVFEPIDYLRDQVEPAVTAWIEGAGFSSKVLLEKLSLYPCDTTGNAIGRNVATLTYGTAPTGGDSGNLLPTENSVVLSFQTHVRGPLGRGRIFPPPVAVDALSSYGLVASSWRSTYLNGGKNLLEGIAYSGIDSAAIHVRPVVTGPTAKVGHPAYTVYGTIIEAKVGQVFDTQRRRRNKLPENYATAAVTY